MIRQRLSVLTAVGVVSLAVASSAGAFDCIRVSSSLQGLQQSTRSGNWLLFDVSSVGGVQRTFELLEDPAPSDAQAQCFVSRYAASGQPSFFALGIGVAGPKGILAFRNERAAMGDGKGIDQLESSGIPAAYLAAVETCDIEVTD